VCRGPLLPSASTPLPFLRRGISSLTVGEHGLQKRFLTAGWDRNFEPFARRGFDMCEKDLTGALPLLESHVCCSQVLTCRGWFGIAGLQRRRCGLTMGPTR
jgi:hypothetical protein